ncbi:hypothetical protein PGT21_019767 [Puccinia graminis f. sp. tritici]|uniref:F-box domain-containing protein n=1 Tax=Puccinia graminis f. sp. tritici TaxID=56615 RepID=A0A5B0MDM0_PUCGR|nr:hypothetical protein PGT21_019767 [Puccinia graminis f. sp. tritici]
MRLLTSSMKKPSLYQLPTEIKKLIVECVALLTEKRRYTVLPQFLKLAFVDHTFYELCSQLNWNELDLMYLGIPHLEELIQNVLPRQAKHVRSIMIGFHPGDEYDLNFKRSTNSIAIDGSDQYPERQLREILKICPNLTKLTVHLDSNSLDEFGNFIIDPSNQMSKLLSPISHLSNLTYIKLNNNTYSDLKEESLVKLIQRMVHLVHICIHRGVAASFPRCDFCECSESIQPTLSPLAVHLATLPSLKVIDFDRVNCFDSGWSKIKWKGALEEIILFNCHRISLHSVHAFCELFENSLVNLSLYCAPISLDDIDGWHILPDSDLKYTFRLPKLKRLSVFNLYPPEFLHLFRQCCNITSISLKLTIWESIAYLPADIKDLMDHDEPIWIHLKSLLIYQKGKFSPDEVDYLIAHGAKAGVKVECGPLSKVGNLFIEECLRDDNFRSQ